MVVKISKKSKIKDINKEIDLLTKKNDKPKFSIKNWSGAIKRGLDGVEYQKQVRNDWQ